MGGKRRITQEEFFRYLAKKKCLKEYLVNWKKQGNGKGKTFRVWYKEELKFAIKHNNYFEPINIAFTWDRTPQDHEFWANLHVELNEKINYI